MNHSGCRLIVGFALSLHLVMWTCVAHANPTQPGRPQNVVSGLVEDEDGNPVKGATILLVRAGKQAYIQSGGPRGDVRQSYARRVTDETGSFSFPCGEGAYWLVALHEKAGCAEVLVRDEDAAPAQHSMVLSPWGRIEGVLRRGAEPLAEHTVSYQLLHGNAGDWRSSPQVHFGDYTTSDVEGRFVFERVPPGVNQVSLVVTRQIARHHMVQSTSHPTVAYVEPGETAHVAIGGTGRSVIGRLVADGVTDWSEFHASLVHVPMPENGVVEQNLLVSRALTRSFFVSVEPNGTFRAHDVQYGEYTLMLSRWSGVDSQQKDQPRQSQSYRGQVTIPPPDEPGAHEPLDVAEVRVSGW